MAPRSTRMRTGEFPVYDMSWARVITAGCPCRLHTDTQIGAQIWQRPTYSAQSLWFLEFQGGGPTYPGRPKGTR